METLVEHAYREAIVARAGVVDDLQLAAVACLDDLRNRLLAPRHPSVRFRLFRVNPKPRVRGLYIWGGVGRGKTFLMDLFFESLPFRDKARMHFHHFMRQVHADLARHKGQSDPLTLIAAEWSQRCRLLCFDEFFVSDIGDAMLLGELLKHLFAARLTLVATSNVAPDLLYANGLQRGRFLPAIAHLQTHNQVLELGGSTDYRLRHLQSADTYCWPLGEDAEAAMQASFAKLSPKGCVQPAATLEVNGRPLQARMVAGDLVWFEFAELCAGPRSQADYIDIADGYHTVLLSNLPRMDSSRDEAARRFISLVDEFYDRRVKLLVSAEAPIDRLYAGERLRFEFERTRSRLLEMQSDDYMALSHRMRAENALAP